MKNIVFQGLMLLTAAASSAQNIDHWETVVQETDTWYYRDAFSNPPALWNQPSFVPTGWQQGAGGFGFGDGDDNTVTNQAMTIYIRLDFNIVDTAVIEQAVFNMDYDDGFVAYINGTEICRSNIATASPNYNTPADGEHEAWMYQGNNPETFVLEKAFLQTFLLNGNNTIAIEVHNRDINSSDISARPFLSLGISDQSSNYAPTPAWFVPPFVFSSSNIPIIRIETNGQLIADEPKVQADMYVYSNNLGNRNYLTDVPSYQGNIGIEIRGQSSQWFPKKCYGFETWDALGNDLDTSFLDLPNETDWILYAPYTDKTLMRNDLIMKMGTEMGRYNTRTRWCEVVVNGEYQGIYQVMEKIKRDKNRVDVAKLTQADTTGEDLTGGYIFKIDKGWDGGWASNFDVVSAPGNPIYFQYVYPQLDSLQPQQIQYIQSYVDSFEQAVADTNLHYGGKHYSEYIDLLSFVDNFIHNEVSRNVDGYRLSSYFHKDKNRRIVAGPLWDFNLSFGNGDYCRGWATDGWMYEEFCDDGNPFWWGEMLTDTMFQQTLRCRWDTLRQTVLDTAYLFPYIDSTVALLDEAQQRNYNRWQILGIYVWPNPSPIPATFEEEISTLKQWISQRLDWMDFVIYPIVANCQPPIDTTIDTTTTIIIPAPLLSGNDFQLYPNPTHNGYFTLQWSANIPTTEGIEIQIFSTDGKRLAQQKHAVLPSQMQLQLDVLSPLPAGLYFLQVTDANRKWQHRQKIIRLE